MATPFTSSVKQHKSVTLRALVAGAALVIVLAGVKLAAAFIIPVALAFFIAVLSYPAVRWLCARRVPRILALLLTLLFYLAVLVAVALLAVSMFSDFQVKWTQTYQVRIRSITLHAVGWLEHTLQSAGIEQAGIREAFDSLVNIDALLKLATDNVGRAFNVMTYALRLTLLVLLLVGFILAGADTFVQRLPSVQQAGGPKFDAWRSMARDIQKYLAIKTLASALTGLAAWGLCSLIGLDFALLWGIGAFVLNYIPAVGSIIAAIPPLVLALILFGWTQALVVGVGYLAINIILGNIVEPLLHGRRFGISAVVVLISVLFWGWILGVAGMFLAVPLTLLLKAVLGGSPELSWISVLIENGRPFRAVPPVPAPLDTPDANA